MFGSFTEAFSCQSQHGQSKNGSERTRLGVPKVIQEVNFTKYLWLWGYLHVRDCSFAHILWFFSASSDSATAECQIQNRMFSSILQQFEEGQRHQLRIDLDAVTTVYQRIRITLQHIKRFVVASAGGATRFANLR